MFAFYHTRNYTKIGLERKNMTSQLTLVSNAIRQYGPAVLIGIFSMIVIWNLGRYGYQACCTSKATPTPMINARLGVLEALPFSQKPTLSTDIKINLETIDGTIPPTATVSAVVYEISSKQAGLDYAPKSLSAAQKAGFKNPLQEEISSDTFLFINPDDQNQKMTYNFVYNNLLYEFENMNSYISLEQGSAPAGQVAIGQARSFFNGVRPDAIKAGTDFEKTFTFNTTYYYLESGTDELKEVDTQPQANLTILNVGRPPIGNHPIIGPSATESLIHFVFSGMTSSQGTKANQFRLLKAKIINWPINTSPATPATYPLKTAQLAWEQLNQGKGYILNQVNPGDEFNMRKVYMAYFEPEILAKTIQPVWVFEGDKLNDSSFLFRAIVPAVADGYYTPIQ
jgi:hypothetical protein